MASQDAPPPNIAALRRIPIPKPGQSALNGLPQVWWPVHCVQNEPGAEFHPALEIKRLDFVVQKGTNMDIDSYSAFYDNGHLAATMLNDWLKAAKISHLYVMGLATDYCVKFTVLDALAQGYKVTVLTDGCRGVNLEPQDRDEAIKAMQLAGAKVSTHRRCWVKSS